MFVADFNYDLPAELIAQHPPTRRGDSRLLVLDSDGPVDRSFSDFSRLLNKDDLLVFNDARVIPARLYAMKETGGRAEILLERLLDENKCIAQVKVSKALKPGQCLILEDQTELVFEKRDGDFFQLRSDNENLLDVFNRLGHLPLPPYIGREDRNEDGERYQTIYADKQVAMAAPTAGLHFDECMLEKIAGAGVQTGFLTLHVGAGTYQPVRCEQVEDHVMHKEYYEIPAGLIEQIQQCRERSGRVVAVGTTSARTLESAANEAGEITKPAGDSQLFIYPGYEFKVVDALLTNFHLPQSTLLMMVCAFAGQKQVLSAYAYAVRQRYRFFSYGDAMFLHCARSPRRFL